MKKSAGEFHRACLWTLAGILFITIALGAFKTAIADDMSEAQSMVYKAKGTLIDLTSDSMFSWLNKYLKDAKGVLIFPQVIKGGFFLGGSGGTGVFMTRDQTTGEWSYPAFYTMGSVTLGLQIGGEAAEVVMVAMSQKAINTLLSSSVKLGGDVSIAAGPVGGGAKGSVGVPEVTTDFVSYTRSKGLYAGLNLEGSLLAVRTGLNEVYYGAGTLPVDIVVMKKASNPNADELRAALEKVTGKKKPLMTPPLKLNSAVPN
ncbi:MAG TPA: lipid-binding SYLF domain-containing protein [Geobacteraceae bacterium]|nr:lipid-binding SYLF domain-containing protein [Geobacteraceae bacterium]